MHRDQGGVASHDTGTFTGGTPARRRLLDSVTGSPSRIGSPARKTRRISGGGEERPSTPSRRSRRLSGCSAGITLLLLVGQTRIQTKHRENAFSNDTAP